MGTRAAEMRQQLHPGFNGAPLTPLKGTTATGGVDSTGDGRVDALVSGLDRNGDGIPDQLQVRAAGVVCELSQGVYGVDLNRDGIPDQLQVVMRV